MMNNNKTYQHRILWALKFVQVIMFSRSSVGMSWPCDMDFSENRKVNVTFLLTRTSLSDLKVLPRRISVKFVCLWIVLNKGSNSTQ